MKRALLFVFSMSVLAASTSHATICPRLFARQQQTLASDGTAHRPASEVQTAAANTLQYKNGKWVYVRK